jgi:hypothetical protein
MLSKLINRFAPALAALALLSSFAMAVNLTGTNSANEFSVMKVGFLRTSTTGSITAFAGGGQTSAVVLNSAVNIITTVGTAADSVMLPPCNAGIAGGVAGYGNTDGMQVTVINSAASNAAAIFPQSGQSINALSANASFSLAAGKSIIFTCSAAGSIWYGNLSAGLDDPIWARLARLEGLAALG